jgi:hypothetical protein
MTVAIALTYADIMARIGVNKYRDLTLFNNKAQIDRIFATSDRSRGVKVDSDDPVYASDRVLAFRSAGQDCIVYVSDYIYKGDYLT